MPELDWNGLPWRYPTNFTLLPDGYSVVVPVRDNEPKHAPLGDPASELRLQIQGVIRCAYNNQSYDALYEFQTNSESQPIRTRPCLAWQPRTPVLEESDVRAHRYVFRIPTLAAGVSPSVRVDVDRFVDEFLIPPSEVRDSLTGQFSVSLTAVSAPAPAAAITAWPVALTAVPGLALVGGMAWVIQRRMTLATLDFDLEAQVARIHVAADAARSAIGNRDGRLAPIRARLKALEAGATKLATQIQQIRRARKQHSTFALERDISALEQRIALADRPAGESSSTVGLGPCGAVGEARAATSAQFESAHGRVTDELQLIQGEKRRALASLHDLEKTEASLAARLDRVESTLESTLAGLQAVKAGATAAPVSDHLCRSLDAEVSALREATRPLPETVLLGRSG